MIYGQILSMDIKSADTALVYDATPDTVPVTFNIYRGGEWTPITT